ncbi:hypothetical protein CJO82_19585 (plasmid) [Ralstonia solanacearum]|nr:hypothetical protein CJO82_19585 [Ralstonia solanacearum]AXW25853.1 hypothetical protein CJO86_19845 [Ralstonia solanacearum]AXW82763.1 hypothetical protein CJO98_19945 [Ralstonia solanacearum]
MLDGLPRRFSTGGDTGFRSSNLSRGLVAMGECVFLRQGSSKTLASAATMGLNPCLGVAVTYDDGRRKRALLAHLQPEANRDELVNQLVQHMPDDFNAEMHVHIASEPADDPEVRADQELRGEALVSAISGKYDFIEFDADNVHRHEEHCLSVSLSDLRVSTKPVTQSFTRFEFDDMQRRMKADPSKVQFYR